MNRPERVDGTNWAERYESLRRYVLEARPLFESPPVGLAVWLAKGMEGWMAQWKAMRDPAPGLPRRAELFGCSSGWQQQLTSLLAQMTLTHLRTQTSHESRI